MKPRTTITRRDALKLGAGVVASGLLPGVSMRNADAAKNIDIATLIKGKIDYTKAKAVPTICFGCTTHCGVIGWVQDGRVPQDRRKPTRSEFPRQHLFQSPGHDLLHLLPRALAVPVETHRQTRRR